MHTRTAVLVTTHAQPLQKLKPLAVVDWVSFIVKLERASHPGYLKRAYEAEGVSRIIPLDAGSGGAASAFRIELQHPACFAVIRNILSELSRSYGFSEAPLLCGLEVATDFLPMNGEHGWGAELTERLMMSISPPVISNPRLADDKQSIILPAGAEITPELTLYIGNRDDDLLWRVYWKRTDETFIGDENKRLPKPLQPNEWRARAEVRIQGSALSELGLVVPADLENFRFERLFSLGYFKFCNHKTGVPVLKSNPFVATAAASLGIDDSSPACVLGIYGKHDKRHRCRSGSRYLTTDTELTDAARTALRGLTRRF
jgi:hypothetical protein